MPTEGMTGWADTWMMSSKAQHPNCMLKWMAWMITPEVQAQVAENFGESPANPKACKYLDAGLRAIRAQGLLHALLGERPGLLRQDRLLEDPAAGLRRRPRPDLHGLLDLDPEMDRDQGLTPLAS